MELIAKLRTIYSSKNVTPTDTLITKILLGTICCTPAYDDYFYNGVMVWKELPVAYMPKFPGSFGKNSYIGVLEFYQYHKSVIDEAQKEISQYGITYPPMKLIDMYFWNIGYQFSKKKNPT